MTADVSINIIIQQVVLTVIDGIRLSLQNLV